MKFDYSVTQHSPLCTNCFWWEPLGTFYDLLCILMSAMQILWSEAPWNIQDINYLLLFIADAGLGATHVGGIGCPIFTLFLNWATPLSPLRLMGCRSSQKKFQRYRPKIDVQRKIFVFDPIYKGKRAKISPKINKIEIWLKSGPKVINSPNQSHRGHTWGMFEL